MMTTETSSLQARLREGCGAESLGFFAALRNLLDFKGLGSDIVVIPLRPHKGFGPHRREIF
jgi:hypothetical protein